jgi:hypothetical protein
MKTLPTLVAAALAAVCVLGPPARAADVTAAVPGHPGVTWFDLAKLVITDLEQTPDGAVGSKFVHFEHVEGSDSDFGPPDQVMLTSVDTAAMPGDPTRFVIMLDLGSVEGYVADSNLLVLVAIDPRPRLIDVTEVGSDRFVAMSLDPKAMLAPGAPLIQIESEHDNSNQTYLSTALVFVKDGKFRWIDNINTLSDHLCAFQRMDEVSASAVPSKRRYRSIAVTVKETVTHTGEECGDEEKPPKAGVRYWRSTYEWDAKTGDFLPNNDAMKRLTDDIAKRY